MAFYGKDDMARYELTLESAVTLHRYVERMLAGAALPDEDQRAFSELREQLHTVVGSTTEWTQGSSNNVFIAGEGWMVSHKIASDTGEPETALIDRQAGVHFLLTGDHRSAYQAAAPAGWTGLRGVFMSLKQAHLHPCSSEKAPRDAL